MPEQPEPKLRPRIPVEKRGPAPDRTDNDRKTGDCSKSPQVRYAELRCVSNFSFLRGASHPDELVARAAALGYYALAITDENTLAGVVRMHQAAQEHGIKLLIGAQISPVDALPVTLYATDRAAYGRLARLITRGRRRMPKGQCELFFDDLAELNEGLLCVVSQGVQDSGAGNGERGTGNRKGGSSLSCSPFNCSPVLAGAARVARYRELFGDRAYLAAELHRGPDDAARLEALRLLAAEQAIRLVAANDVHYHVPARRYLQDVLTCIRTPCTLADAGTRLLANAERHLKTPEEMVTLFAACPEAIARTVEVADRCHFSLDELRYEYPEELCPAGMTPISFLTRLTWDGARERYPDGVPDKTRQLIEHELHLIEELKYETYFLTVWDLVRFARSHGILCQGRGSAANSAVCYCLGVTSVDPERIDLLFERFVSRERNEPPDIDIDFEHERREEVFQYIYGKYGRERAGIAAEVITYRPRSAVRDVGKALGLSLDRVDRLAKTLSWWGQELLPEERLREAGLDPNDRTVRCLRWLVEQIVGFPRHLSQHVGGFVMTRGPLCEMVPIENAAMPDRTFIEWDKDDIDALGILKVDCLALGMLTAIRKCLGLLHEAEGRRDGGTEGQRSIGPDLANPDRRVSNGTAREARQEDVSQSDCLAESDSTRQADLPGHPAHAQTGTVWPDGPNEARSSLDSLQHRRGQCAPDAERLHSLSGNGARLVGGTGDPTHHRDRAEHDSRDPGIHGAAGRNRSRAPGTDPQPTESPQPPQRIVDAPSSLRPSVPSSLHNVPPEDPAVYHMMCRADTVGVFQIESRAQMSMLPRLRPRRFYDLVIEVAIVRPGPIQGGMVHPYLRRRAGEEPVTYPSDAVKEVLRKTLGVPIFQEQAMRLAVVAAGFTPGEADALRRAMGAWRRRGVIEAIRDKLINGMLANGYSRDFAQQIYDQISGFGEYGFPESHSASFALLVYASAWLKHYHPAAFAAGLLNSCRWRSERGPLSR